MNPNRFDCTYPFKGLCGAGVAFKFALVILRTQEALEDSLDILDETHANISTILDRPLFHDSPEIRGVLNDIHTARTSVLSVANALTKIDSPEELKDEDT